MSIRKKVLLLVGSSKQKQKGSSWLLGSFLLKSLSANDFEAKTLHLASLINSEKWIEELIDAINHCSLIIFSSPLYANSLPSFVIRVMDEIKANKKNINGSKQIFVISNCGYPEARQNIPALCSYRQFAKDMNFNWLGALSFGMGSLLCRWHFLNIFGMFNRIKKAISISAAAISQNETIPLIAQEIAAKPLIPMKLYNFLANLSFRKTIALNLFMNFMQTNFRGGK